MIADCEDRPRSFEEGMAFYKTKAWRECRRLFTTNTQKPSHCPGCDFDLSKTTCMVDHIRPIRLYWGLRLDQGNLQYLCEDCNRTKGNSELEIRAIGEKVKLNRWVHGIKDLHNPPYRRRTSIILKKKQEIESTIIERWGGPLDDAKKSNRIFRNYVINFIRAHITQHRNGKSRSYDDGIRVLAEEFFIKSSIGEVKDWYERSLRSYRP